MSGAYSEAHGSVSNESEDAILGVDTGKIKCRKEENRFLHLFWPDCFLVLGW